MRQKEKLTLPCCILLVTCFLFAAGQTLEQFCQSEEPIPVNAICSTLGLTGDDPAVCPAIGLIEQLALKLQPPRCRVDAAECAGVELPPRVDPQGTVLPQDLPDVRSYHVGLPETLPYKVFMKHEGSTYFWYYRNLLTFFNWVPCTTANSTSGSYQYKAGDSFPAPKGWEPIEVFDLPPPEGSSLPGLSADPLPFAALLRPDPSGSYERRDSCKKWYTQASKVALQSKAAGSSRKGAKKASSRSSVKTAAQGNVRHISSKSAPAPSAPVPTQIQAAPPQPDYRAAPPGEYQQHEPYRPWMFDDSRQTDAPYYPAPDRPDDEPYRPTDRQYAKPYYPTPDRAYDEPYRPTADVDRWLDRPYHPAADSQRDQPHYPTDDGAYRRYSEPYHPAAERRYDGPHYPADEFENQYYNYPPRYMYQQPSDDQRPGEPYYQRFAPDAGDAPRDYVDSPTYQELPYRGTDGYRPYDDERRGAHERPYDEGPYETEEVESPRHESPSDYNDRDRESDSDRDVEDAPYDEPSDEGYQFEGDRYDEEFSYPCGEAEEGEGDESDSKYGKHTSPHLILLVRSTITLQEWGLGLAYNQVEGATAGLAYGPGKFAAGYFYAAQAVWAGGLGEAIEREIAEGCRSITVAGYSLGAAVAQLLAIRIEGLISAAEESTYAAKLKGAKPSPVTVVTFGSPNPGDATWATYFNKKVNARNIAFEGDLIAKIPCEPQMVGCPPPVSVPTTPGPWQYKRTGGNILFPASAMPFSSKYDVAQSWGALTKLTGWQICNADTFTSFTAATHICSYLCMTSPYVDEDLNMCWLDKSTPAPKGASLCAGCVG